MIFPTLLFSKIILLSVLSLHVNFGVILLMNTKILFGNLIGIVLNLYINLERINILLCKSFILMNIVCLMFCSLEHTAPVHVLVNLYLSMTFWGGQL